MSRLMDLEINEELMIYIANNLPFIAKGRLFNKSIS